MNETPARREAPSARTVEAQVGKYSGEPTAAHDPQVPLSTRIPESLRKDIRMAALRHDMSVQDVVTDALRAWLTRND